MKSDWIIDVKPIEFDIDKIRESARNIKHFLITEEQNDIFLGCYNKKQDNKIKERKIPVYLDRKPKKRKIGYLELNMSYDGIDLFFSLNIDNNVQGLKQKYIKEEIDEIITDYLKKTVI